SSRKTAKNPGRDLTILRACLDRRCCQCQDQSDCDDGSHDAPRIVGLTVTIRQTSCTNRKGDLLQVRNGLLVRSRPIVLAGPWPQIKAMSSPSGRILFLIDAIKVAWSPPGKSVRPTELRKSTSPTMAKRSLALTKTMLPGEWPGQCSTLNARSPISARSPS